MKLKYGDHVVLSSYGKTQFPLLKNAKGIIVTKRLKPPMVHSHGKDRKEWEEGKKKWAEAIEKDCEIMEILRNEN